MDNPSIKIIKSHLIVLVAYSVIIGLPSFLEGGVAAGGMILFSMIFFHVGIGVLSGFLFAISGHQQKAKANLLASVIVAMIGFSICGVGSAIAQL